MEKRQFDIVIIGAGIIGSMVARALSRYKLSIAVVEKEADVGMGQSSANSAILHSGHDPFPGTMKARMNKRGNELWRTYARDLHVDIAETGAMVAAFGPEDRKRLRPLYDQALANKIPGVEIWSREQALQREPYLSPDCSGALWTPTAAIIDVFEGVIATAENAVMNGVEFYLDTAVQNMIIEKNRLVAVQTNNGEFQARWFINAAGVHSDEIMHMAGDRPEFRITPRRGEYAIIDSTKLRLSNVIFPIPTKKGKGILVTATVHGNTLIGPNAYAIDEKEDTSTTRDGFREVIEQAQKSVPALNPRDIIAMFAGVRASGNYAPDGEHRDFLIEISKQVKGLVNAVGIESPGFVSAPAIAEEVVRLLASEGGEILEENPSFNGIRPARVRFSKLSHEERAALIQSNPAYGRIVCRCEEVTEGEIIDAIHAPIPAVTYDAIKRRTWLGTGRCQGSFDCSRTLEILSRETGIPITEITKRGPGSAWLLRQTKETVQQGGGKWK